MDGNWHHVAGTYDSYSRRAIYRDGAKLAEEQSGGYYPPAFLGPNLAIGSYFDGTSASHYYSGGIDEVRVWTRARSADEICQTLNQRLIGNEPGLAGYWRFDEGVGTTTGDSSGHGLTGLLVNNPNWVASGAMNAVPVETTGLASNITAHAASLTGSGSICGLATSAWFEYGTSVSYGQSTPPVTLGNGTHPAPFVQTISSLNPDTLYHFRALAMNSGGQGAGADQQFVTAGPPRVITLGPASVTPNAVTLQASIDPDGLATLAWFEWGTSTSYGTVTATQTLSGSGGISTVVQSLSSLVAGQTYHYRALGTNDAGTAFGQDQTFTPAFSSSFLGCFISDGSVAWGDYDRNGYMDLLVTGGTYTNTHTCLFRNDGGALSYVPDLSGSGPGSAGLPPVQSGTAMWGDFDNDGALDVLLAGYTDVWRTSPSTQVALNRMGLFTNFLAGFVGVGRACAAVGDYNNDGFLDFVIAGTTTSYNETASPTNVLYRNNGDGTFTDVQGRLPAVFDGAMAWGDFNNDGQLDLAIIGNTGSEYITRIYRNDGGVFTDIGANLPGVCCGSVVWGDYDNDGQLDLLLLGQTNADVNSAICRIYRNNGGIFTDIGAGLPSVSAGAAAWGDYDGDGQLDVLLTGHDNTLPGPPYQTATARIFHNNQGVFSDIQTGLAGVSSSAVAFGDYDNDGQLDLAVLGVLGASPGLPGLQVYRNFVLQPATNLFAPSAPTGLTSAVSNNSVVLSWKPASDAHTPTPGLTYNLRIGTTAAGLQIVAPQSDTATGKRRVPQMGNAEHRLFTILTNVPSGVYYWSVQAVNNSFAGSPWTPEQTFRKEARPQVVSLSVQSGPSYLLRFIGSSGASYTIEASTNMIYWLALSNVAAASDGSFNFLDTGATNLQARFYRLRVP
jgi:Concanavalin A-like lectin/glucanases superfamily/FG-GAP-like repeat